MLIEHQSREIVQKKWQQFVRGLSFKCEFSIEFRTKKTYLKTVFSFFTFLDIKDPY